MENPFIMLSYGKIEELLNFVKNLKQTKEKKLLIEKLAY